MKKMIIGCVIALGLIGCDGGSTTVEPAKVTIEPTEVTVLPAEVNVTVIIEDAVPVPLPEDVAMFDGLTVSYDMSEVNCKGGEVGLTMLFKSDDAIDEFSFILSHTVNGGLVDFSNVNVNVGAAVTRVSDTIYIGKNKTDEPIRHGLSISYYDEEVRRLSNHYFDVPVCEDK